MNKKKDIIIIGGGIIGVSTAYYLALQGRSVTLIEKDSFEKGASTANLLREFGVEASLLDADGVRRVEPNVMPAVTHGIYCAAYAHVSPDRFVHEMVRLAKDQGVEIITGTSVSGFETSGQQISLVVTSGGRFIPNQVVLAAGAWSTALARSLRLKLPIQPAKGYSLTYKRPSTSPHLPLSLSERMIAVTPMGGTLRFTSVLELVGFDPSLNQRRLAAIRSSVNEYLPGMEELEQEAVWFGYRPATPDDLPIIGRSEKFKNLILATGHGTLGMTYGLITGKLVSQIIAEEQPTIDLTPLKAGRFYG